MTNANGKESADQGSPPRKRNATAARVLLALKRRVDKHYRRQQEQYSDHQRNERVLAEWTRRLGQFTIVLATVAILGLVVSWKTLTDNADALHRSQRPWVVAEKIEAISVGEVPVEVCKVGYRVSLRNTGNS